MSDFLPERKVKVPASKYERRLVQYTQDGKILNEIWYSAGPKFEAVLDFNRATTIIKIYEVKTTLLSESEIEITKEEFTKWQKDRVKKENDQIHG